MHTWFDAFRTLKLIHALREKLLPSVSYSKLVTNQTFRLLLKQDPGLLGFKERFESRLSS